MAVVQLDDVNRLQECVRLLSTGPYERLAKHPWWSSLWTIASRPGTIDQEIGYLEAPHPWQETVLPDSDFQERTWLHSSTGRIEYTDDGEHSSIVRLDNAQAPGKWTAIASPVTRLVDGEISSMAS